MRQAKTSPTTAHPLAVLVLVLLVGQLLASFFTMPLAHATTPQSIDPTDIRYSPALTTTTLVPTTAASGAATTANQTTGLNPYGVNTFLEKEVETPKKERTMQLISQGGIGWIKQQFPWDEIEFKKGYFVDDKFKKSSWQKYDEIVNLAVKNNVKIVARVDRSPQWARLAEDKNPQHQPANFKDYADFITEFVNHYKGKITHIQIWNEPNLKDEWNGKIDPAKYAELLKLSYEAAKKADPNIKILSAPLAMTLETLETGNNNLNELDFITQLYAAGGKPYFDMMSANGYGLGSPPEEAPDKGKLNFRRVELLHDIMVKNGDTTKQIWFNEYGWNASPSNFPKEKLIWSRVSEQQQADYTVNGIKYAQQNWPWAGVMFIWYFRQVGDIPQDRSDYYFQMVTTDFKTKPVYEAVKKDALAFIAKSGQPTPIAGTPVVVPNPGGATSPGASPVAAISVTPNPNNGGGAPLTTTSSGTSTTVPGTAVASAPTVAVATPGAVNTTGNTSSTDNSGALIFIILGGVVVLAAAGGLGYYFFSQNRR